MKNRILGFIGVVWGGGVLLYGLFGNRPEGADGAYQSGQTFGLIFGAALLAVGLYYLLRGSGKKGISTSKYSSARSSTRPR